MLNKKKAERSSIIICVPFQEKYWQQYMKIYNECFYEMRKKLEVEPYNFYSDFTQMRDKVNNTFLYLQNEIIAGAVSCYGNEIDDLFVNKSFQGNGYGKELLLWGMKHIKDQVYDEISLRVAEWNQHAISLYSSMGFEVVKIEKVR